MRIRSTGLGMAAVIGMGFLALLSSQEARAQVKLGYKYQEGKKLTYKSTSKMQQILTINGMEIPTDVDSTSVTSQVVGKRRDDATLPIEQKTESMHVELSAAGGVSLTYDSSNPDAKIEDDRVAFLGEAFKLAGEAVYTVVLDGRDKVKAVEGLEKLQEKAEKLGEQAQDLLRGQFDPDRLKVQFEQSHANLPDVLARPGESWERTETTHVGGGQTLIYRRRYEYAGTEKKGDKTLDKITSKAIEVKYSMDPEAKSPLKIAKSDLKIESSDGTILFDREAGYVVDAKGKTQIKGSATFTINGMELPGELDLTLETTTQLQPAAK
jgi:Family of unknown function (DUF6263)